MLALLVVAPTETVKLRPTSGAKATGTAVAGQHGSGTRITFSLRGLPPGQSVRAMLQAGTCAHTGAGFATIGAGRANAGGTARWHASVIFHGAPVDWSSIADGRHAIRILSGSRPLGCGVIPGLS